MKIRVLTILLLLGAAVHLQAASLSPFTQEADAFFKKYVRNGMVDYAKVKSDGAVTTLYDQVGSMSLTNATAAQKKAFYINAYNIVVIKSIVDKYPVGSPMDINGFFDGAKHKVAGDMLTLNELEKTKLLRVYEDARIHFVVVCAAQGCPKLASFAYSADKLESQIQAQTRKSLNDEYFIRIRRNGVQVSKIFEWYESDFTKSGQSIVGYINEFRDEKIPTSFRKTSYEYDWTLNKQ
ncbi:MAG TPA: DUF547 domain-containing protein [Cytophagales bacterium]|nr:DUF547 domain-containing protein [Cytophagales bacterium]HAA23359.1 DUF547 domain-containing protein [Cytophagales bacterium]HAP65030.1 DUF547 domain-containing protein [Cytophagales bacterium]